MIKYLFPFVLMAQLLAGCASDPGNRFLHDEDRASIDQKVIDHTTTRADVAAMFGEPLKAVSAEDGRLVWTYQLTHTSADGTSHLPVVGLFAGSSSGSTKTLVITFDRHNVVDAHRLDEVPVRVRNGVLNQLF
ncbi:hypothetical protein FEF65_04825 [Mariprofundus erugo]|uniref:Outer membrane protein assembly factor BamE n=1 Tax=Mariprofundus erugo TaxID=2528639 RepID=A0A5R9GRZ0_9PROT|nr:hypothetical protein [Mariprofundus erugo]TLS68318.1 hypothetical protein FEF65_04825 [Mariprofundus erugo]